jgi:capsular exopolysaccharide synthesis family protein
MENLNIPEEQSTAEMITEYAGLLWRWAWLLILLALLAGGTAYYLSNKQTPLYQASALAMINAAPSSADSAYYVTLGQSLADSYSKLMTTLSFRDSVAQLLGFPYLPGSVQVTPITNTQLLYVTVTDTDPVRAALIANTLVTVFNEQIQADQATRYADSEQNLKTQMDALDQQIQTSLADLAVLGQEIQDDDTTLTALLTPDNITRTQQELDQRASLIQQIQSTLQSRLSQQAQMQGTLQNYRYSYSLLLQSYESIRLAESQSSSGVLLKDPAVPPGAPIQPQPFRSAMLAAVVGLFLGAGIVFLIEFLDDSLRDPQEITRKWGIPVLGMIVNFESKNGNELITEKQPRSPVSEAFRSLRTNLQFTSVTSPLHTLLVTSPSPEDGKTTIVGNLACVFAQVGRKVVVVDSDLRRPALHKLFERPNRFGLTDQFIHPQEYLNGAVQPTEIKNLYLLSSGSLPPNPSELISSHRMVEIIQSLEAQYEVVFLDAPPSLVVTDANVLANHADGVILVIRPSTTKRAAIKHTIEQLAQVKANIVGVVLNGVDVRKTRYSYYRGYYNKYGRGYAYYWDGRSSGTGKKIKSRKSSARETPHGFQKAETRDAFLNTEGTEILESFRKVQMEPVQSVRSSTLGASDPQGRSVPEYSLPASLESPRENPLSSWIGKLRSRNTSRWENPIPSWIGKLRSRMTGDRENPLEPGSKNPSDRPDNKP